MKTAIDFYDRGKMKESNADEYSSGGYYFKGRFICPECGEPVHISKSRYSNFFSHFQKTEFSAECDRRVDGVTNSSIYERMGVPIYLRDNGSSGSKNKQNDYNKNSIGDNFLAFFGAAFIAVVCFVVGIKFASFEGEFTQTSSVLLIIAGVVCAVYALYFIVQIIDILVSKK